MRINKLLNILFRSKIHARFTNSLLILIILKSNENKNSFLLSDKLEKNFDMDGFLYF